MLFALGLLTGGAPVSPMDRVSIAGTPNVQVDFAKYTDTPLFKKFSMYNSGVVTLNRYKRDLGLIDSLRADNLRIDMFMGNHGTPFGNTVTGTLGHMVYDFHAIDEWAKLLNQYNVLPYISYCYIPVPLQRGGDWKSGPVSFEAWGQVLKTLAQHFRTNGIPVGYQEIYNEPDLHDAFFTGTWDQYLQMYKYGSEGILRGDPDASVGGPASFDPNFLGSKLDEFVNFVKTNRLPLDFFSFHSYGPSYLSRISMVQDGLQNHPGFETTELHLNEFNPEPGPYDPGSAVDRYTMAPEVLDSINALLPETDVTDINWAQFMDDALGIVNSDGRITAAYNALRLYARMPVERVQVKVEPSLYQGHAMASTDGHTASVLLWNDGFLPQTFSVQMNHIPFPRGTVEVFRIDKHHGSGWDDPRTMQLQPVERIPNVVTNRYVWSGSIPEGGVVYLELRDGSHISEFTPVALGRIIKITHDFTQRGQDNYGMFDRRTWTAWLGMGSNSRAHSIVGVTADHLPSVLSVSFQPLSSPLINLENSSTEGLRIDYQVRGRYKKSVYFYNASLHAGQQMVVPWGTRRAPDEAVAVSSLKHFSVQLSKYAPMQWNGRIILSYVLQATGQGTRVKVTIRKGKSQAFTIGGD